MPEIRKGDTVVVLTGRDAGKRGTVDRVIRPQGLAARRSQRIAGRGSRPAAVVIEGINIAKRHTKPRQSSSSDRPARRKIEQGGILEIAQPCRSARS